MYISPLGNRCPNLIGHNASFSRGEVTNAPMRDDEIFGRSVPVAANRQLRAVDGFTLGAYEAMPADNEPKGGLVIIQEIFGVNSHIRDVCDRYANEGYPVSERRSRMAPASRFFSKTSA